ncbi:MAG: Inositol 1, 3, 4-trisphosphate 5/6-kinase [Promethearchaeota archaeon]|nr:MAG: Inositol 1, 3, 4-trisphosphate 5/6-kinase [Candidatus Lokiarchaeota archaeon]
MTFKILFSAVKQHEVLKTVIKRLKVLNENQITVHDPTKNCLELSNMDALFADINLLILKVRNERSIDLLHYANIHQIPSLHDVNTVLLCKNKVALDHAFRKIFNENKSKIKNIFLPESWTNSLGDLDNFKKWAKSHIPFVIKSHYQHDKYMRFNFLVKDLEEDINYFCERYGNFLYYDVYIQKFIKCDGYDRKIYVVGDKVFGIKRENPIYIFLRDHPKNIDTSQIKTEEFIPSEEMEKLALILGKELDLKIFGFDLVKPTEEEGYYLLDLNDFPGFRGISNIEEELARFLSKYINKIKRKHKTE